MSIDLKPCPFCGQQPEVEEWRRGAVIAHRNCPVGVDSFSDDPNGDGFGVYFSDLESAAEAWNTRAERTCVVEEVIKIERPLAAPRWDYQLSCGHFAYEWPWKEAPAYCPDCGAKVVG